MPDRNRLAAESSPYLLQHADNPVDWYPWGDEALALARDAGKPILLSIGYSACHWCHVMARESFADEATAEVMNRLFVNIKVDREERPDIDSVYQTAHRLLTQRPGGWPLTMFIDPSDQRPFFGGTYFPRDSRYGMPAFVDLLQRAAAHFHDSGEAVREQGERLVRALEELEPDAPDAGAVLDGAPLAAARDWAAGAVDRDHGGIGSAPKFPHTPTLDRLLRHWRASASGPDPDVEALFLVTLTLLRMAQGGIYDQLGGGFYRYSVDRYWQIPHFEKMLYDNGPLLALYAQAYLATGDATYLRVAEGTGEYLIGDLRSPEGGFYATRDADSEGAEGRYYVWTPDEVRALLNADHYAAAAAHYGLDQPPNFDDRWHLTVHKTPADLADDFAVDEEALSARIGEARAALLARRGERPAPARDEKQLASWNALAIRGFAIAGRAAGRPDFVQVAVDAADFVRDRLFFDERLAAGYKDGTARRGGYLDDHAFLLDALLELLQARWSADHLAFAVAIAELLLTHFEDAERGGFYFTADDAEVLMQRPKPLLDEALPSGNGIAAFALQRLGYLLGDDRYLDAAERTLRFGWSTLSRHPQGHDSLLTALEEYLQPPEIVVIRGPSAEMASWQSRLAAVYAPRRLVLAVDAAERELPAALAARKAPATGVVAYRCVGHQCSLPIATFDDLARALQDEGRSERP